MKISGVFFVILIAACVWFPRNSFPEDQSAGFYAGPLSAAAEVVVVKSKSDSQDMPQKIQKTWLRSQEVLRKKLNRFKEHDEETSLSRPTRELAEIDTLAEVEEDSGEPLL